MPTDELNSVRPPVHDPQHRVRARHGDRPSGCCWMPSSWAAGQSKLERGTGSSTAPWSTPARAPDRGVGPGGVPFGSYVAFHGEKLPGYYGWRASEDVRPPRPAGRGRSGRRLLGLPLRALRGTAAMQSCVSGARRTVPSSAQPADHAGRRWRSTTTGSAYAAGREGTRGGGAGMLATYRARPRPADHPARRVARHRVSARPGSGSAPVIPGRDPARLPVKTDISFPRPFRRVGPGRGKRLRR